MAERTALKITRETSGEIRSCVNHGAFSALIHPGLGASGGRMDRFEPQAVNGAERIAPGTGLYLLEGVEVRNGSKIHVLVIHVLRPGESLRQAAESIQKHWEVTRS